jgi:hypothetical protein
MGNPGLTVVLLRIVNPAAPPSAVCIGLVKVTDDPEN